MNYEATEANNIAASGGVDHCVRTCDSQKIRAAAGLIELIRAWPRLSEAVRQGFVDIAKSYLSGRRSRAEDWRPGFWPFAGRVGLNSRQMKWPVRANWPRELLSYADGGGNGGQKN
jgi:hypothetical protein